MVGSDPDSGEGQPVATPGRAVAREADLDDSALVGVNELVADSLGEYIGAAFKRIRNGESGMLPVVVGLLIIVIIFQSQNGLFLSGGNLVNLLNQSSYIIVFGLAEVFVLLLGEIDLSVAFNGAVGGIITAELAAPPHNVNWLLAVLAGVGFCTVVGTIIGLLVTRLGLPSFIVSLAFFLALPGVSLFLLNHDTHASGGSIDITNHVLNNLVNGSLSPTVTWIVTVAAVAAFGVISLLRDVHRRQSGLVTPPLALTLLKVLGMALGGLVLVLVCNHNRGRGFVALRGMPWVIPIVVALVAIYTFMLNRIRLGRYLYAIGGNAEAARRAGISLTRIRMTAFVLAGFTGGIGGIILTSFLGSASANSDGGTNVLFGVAAAVIGGTSLFGGRGKMVHAVLGGLVIASIANGMSLIGLGASSQAIVNGVVLLAAVTVDAVARRGRATV
jgi:D-xylose transport system permease protein